MDSKPAAVFALLTLTLLQGCCEGFDFTLDSQLATSSPNEPSAMLVCIENVTTSFPAERPDSRKIARLALYKKSKSEPNNQRQTQVRDDTTGSWKLIVGVTSKAPSHNQVSDGMHIDGRLWEKGAAVIVNFFKENSYRFAEFLCVAELEDDEGRKSVKRSQLGNAVATESFDTFQHEAKFSKVYKTSGVSKQHGPDTSGSFSQSLGSLSLKLDLTESRVIDSLRVLENRLEDKITSLLLTATDKLKELDNNVVEKIRMSELRVGERIEKLEDRFGGKLSRADGNTETKETCESSFGASIRDISGQIADVVSSVRTIEKNVSTFEDVVKKLEESAGRCVSTTNASVSNPTNLTEQWIDFRDAYAGGALVAVDEFSDPLDTGKKEWKLVFRGTPYINVKIYPAYLHGTGVPREVEKGCKQFNSSLHCVNHYRDHDALAKWENIYEVLFAIYYNDKVVKYVLFNGKGSTYTDWFAAGRVVLSSWDDLTSQPHNFFSIVGESTSEYLRRFFMNLDYHQGCDGFRGWFYAADSLPGMCAADKTVAHPKFMYASGSTFAVWSSTSVALADAIGVFVKYGE